LLTSLRLGLSGRRSLGVGRVGFSRVGRRILEGNSGAEQGKRTAFTAHVAPCGDVQQRPQSEYAGQIHTYL